jgi:hypothetical protein
MDQPIVVRKYRGKSEGSALEQMAADASIAGMTLEARSWSGPSLARSIVTPVILLIAGYLIYGQVGAILGALAGVAYLAFVIVISKGTLTATFRRG